MKFKFDPLFSNDPTDPRPIVMITIVELGVPAPALVDSGATGIRFSSELADQAGIDRSAGSTTECHIGASLLGHTLPTKLKLGSKMWNAPVTFLENWTSPYGVLGTRGFFDEFDIRFKLNNFFYVLPKKVL